MTSNEQEVKQILADLKGKTVVNAETDGSVITLEFDDGFILVIDRGYYEDFVPDNSFLTVNDLELF